MPKDFDKEIEAVTDKFREIADGLYLDPSLEYEIKDVEVIDRRTMTGEGTEKVFVINVKTTNRAQLLGQVSPFNSGDYRGYFNNFYSAKITEMLERKFNPEYTFFISINAELFDDESFEYLDKHLSLKNAIDQGIVSEDSGLVKKMREYDLESLILAGGTVITGPLPGSMNTMETIFENHDDIKTVLDIFCGSGSLSKVALSNGATSAKGIDLNTTSAEKNLQENNGNVNLQERDALEFEIEKDYDMIIADPYYDLADDFIDQKFPSVANHCKYFFMTLSFIDNHYWEKKMTDKLKEYFESFKKYDTGRMIQFFGKSPECKI